MMINNRKRGRVRQDDDKKNSSNNDQASGDNKNQVVATTDKKSNEIKIKSISTTVRTQSSSRIIIILVLVIVAIITSCYVITSRWYYNGETTNSTAQKKKLIVYYGILIVSMIPVVLSLYCAVMPKRNNNNNMGQRLIPLSLVLAVVGGKLPMFISSAIYAIGITVFSLVTRPPQPDNKTTTTTTATITTTSTTQHQQQAESNNNDTETTTTTSSLQSDNNKPKANGGSNSSNNNNQDQQIQSSAAAAAEKRQGLAKAALGALFMTVVLLFENVMIWVVSATFVPGHNPETAPPPLQDNGRLIMNYLLQSLSRREVVSLRRIWNVQWGLVATFTTAMAIVEILPNRQIWKIGLRGIFTMTAARFLRTMSFLLTVVPSQNKYCYSQHFPNPPPDDTWEWIKVGFLPSSHGGCNDLIISGHATVTATLACFATSVANDNLFSVALWSLVALDYMVEVYEGFHYSVDMWLGAVVVSLLWRVLERFEKGAPTIITTTAPQQKTLSSLSDISVKEIWLYIVPSIVGYLQVARIFPESWVNPLIAIFALVCVGQVIYHGVKQYTQHHLFLMLYISLGIYM